MKIVDAITKLTQAITEHTQELRELNARADSAPNPEEAAEQATVMVERLMGNLLPGKAGLDTRESPVTKPALHVEEH